MKKIGIILVLFFGSMLIKAQGQRIALTAYKQIEKTDGKWDKWPSQWTTYQSEGRAEPEIEIIEKNAKLGIYNLKYYVDGELAADFNLVYDSEKSAKIRKDWNDKYVNCYTDGDDYVYVQGLSLQGLAKDSNSWATNEKSKLYMWMPNDNFAVVVR